MSRSESASLAAGPSTPGSPTEGSGCHAVVGLLLGRVPFAAAILTAEGRIERLNKAMADAIGAPIAELMGTDLFEQCSSEGSR
ncbi:MAG: hypothetical protein H5U40_19130, partial [Polyangiaceae bacterium]|nr:hypothetical protein [Polyangiaceae bacterium]